MEQKMKHKIKHMKNDPTHEKTVAWLTQTIDTELARGEEADEQLILECTAYLEELSPEAAPSAEVTEKYLQAELKNTKSASCPVRRKAPRMALKIALRLAAVFAALAMFCAAVPAMAIYISNESNFEDEQTNALNPMLELLSYTVKQDPIDYAEAQEFVKETGYSATYSDTAEMIKTELPPDILCPNDLPEELGKYQVRGSYTGYNTIEHPFNVWEIRWKAENESWLFSAAHRKKATFSSKAYYELLYDSYESNGRTYFHWLQKDGQYRAFCTHGSIVYNVLAADYETMIFLIDHATPASEIIPSANKVKPLLMPDQYNRPESYSMSYDTTADFIEFENLNILAVDDAAEGLGDFGVEVKRKGTSQTNLSEWHVRWQDSVGHWYFTANYLPGNQDFRRAEYESFPDFFEHYTVNGRTFYISEISAQAQEALRSDYKYLVNYFEGNIIYSINVTDRETMELLLNSLVMVEDLIAR